MHFVEVNCIRCMLMEKKMVGVKATPHSLAVLSLSEKTIVWSMGQMLFNMKQSH